MPRASDIGFCVVDSNADLVAGTLVRRLRDASFDLERDVNRLVRGREAFALDAATAADLDKAIDRLARMADSLRGVRRAQGRDKVAYLQAAE